MSSALWLGWRMSSAPWLGYLNWLVCVKVGRFEAVNGNCVGLATKVNSEKLWVPTYDVEGTLWSAERLMKTYVLTI